MRYVFRDGEWVEKAYAPPKRQIHLSSDYKPYDCPVTGKVIDGRTAHRDNLRRHGCRILEKGESREFQKNQERDADRALEAAISQAVESIAHQI